jgi:hypothetical protein
MSSDEAGEGDDKPIGVALEGTTDKKNEAGQPTFGFGSLANN